MTVYPIFPGVAEAPITATDFGLSIFSIPVLSTANSSFWIDQSGCLEQMIE
jgi:hypothetical protein